MGPACRTRTDRAGLRTRRAAISCSLATARCYRSCCACASIRPPLPLRPCCGDKVLERSCVECRWAAQGRCHHLFVRCIRPNHAHITTGVTNVTRDYLNLLETWEPRIVCNKPQKMKLLETWFLRKPQEPQKPRERHAPTPRERHGNATRPVTTPRKRHGNATRPLSTPRERHRNGTGTAQDRHAPWADTTPTPRGLWARHANATRTARCLCARHAEFLLERLSEVPGI